jgi:Transposase DDE domain group 1
MVQDDEPVGLDGVRVVFDDERVVSDAGIALAATLAERLQIERLVSRFVRLRRDRPGACNAGRKVMALIFAMVLGADCIDDCALLRAGRTRRLLGGWLPAPSTVGTFLRAFTFGHVRQLDRVLAETMTRAWRAGAGPGEERLVVDVDSFVGEVHGYQKEGVGFGYTNQRGYHPMLASRAGTGEVGSPVRNQRVRSRIWGGTGARLPPAGSPVGVVRARLAFGSARAGLRLIAAGRGVRSPMPGTVARGAVL